MTIAPAEKSWTVALRAKSANELEIAVYDVIGQSFWGDGISSKDFLAQLRAAPDAKKISLRVNSVGGIVDEAKAMVNLLLERAANGVEIVATVDGIAASAASYLLTAANRVEMPANAFQMLHGVRGGVRGTAGDLEEAAALFRRMNDQLAEAYAAASERRGKKQTKQTYLELFAAGDTYLDADQAIEYGLADAKLESLKAAACLADIEFLDSAPDALKLAPYVALGGRQPRAVAPAPVVASSDDDGSMPMVGDRIKVVVTPHMPEHTTGIVRQNINGALGIEFDSMPGKVHHWYLPSEVMVTQPGNQAGSGDPEDGDGAMGTGKRVRAQSVAANTQSPATQATSAPSAVARDPGKGNTMKTISLVAIATVLGLSAEQIEKAEEKDILEAAGKLKAQASAPHAPSVEVSGVKLVGVATEGEAATKIQDMQRGLLQVLGAAGKPSVAEAVAIFLDWKEAAENVGRLTKQVAQLTEESRISKRDASIEKMSREGWLPVARHEWARTQFATADAVETFCTGMPKNFFNGIKNEITEQEDANQVVLNADEKQICKTLGLSEAQYIEQKKLMRKAS